jgi:hypothetical protein
VILSLWTTSNPKEDRGSFELGPNWFAAVEEKTAPELATEMRFDHPETEDGDLRRAA